MTTFPFFQVDAFTDVPLGGNPCAILFDADELDDDQMQAIAQEMNLSETSFVCRSEIADFKVRYFTPAEEIPLAGHPTIATTFALIEAGRIKLTGARTTITLEMKAGVIPVEIRAEIGIVQRITMTQNRPEFLRTYSAEEVLPAFGLSPEDVSADFPIQTVSTGTPQLMVLVKDHDTLRRARVDYAAYNYLRARGDFFSPHLFCLGGISPEGAVFARHFGVPPDTPEDPFTGSATGGMAAYLWRYGLLDRPTFIAEQGHWMRRPGKAIVEIIGGRDSIEQVKVGGNAALIVQGEIYLPIPNN